MPFQFETKKINDVEVIQLMDTTLGVSIDILSRGALLNSWCLNQHDQKYQFIIGNKIESNVDFEKLGFRSAKMSPYVCRLHQGKYQHENTTFTMDHFYMGEHAIHGIMYDANFVIQTTEANENNASVILTHHYLGSDKGYPFNFTMEVKWTLEKNNKIIVQTKVINDADTNIPIVDGWHPYFTIGETINNCTLQFLSKGKMEYDSNLLPTGNIIQGSPFAKGLKLNEIQLDDGYELEEVDKKCTLQNDQFILTIIPTKGYPYLQLYIPPDRKSIAIENLSGAPNAFNNKMGLQLLEPHKQSIFETSYQVTVK